MLIYPDGRPIEGQGPTVEEFMEQIINAASTHAAEQGGLPRFLFVNQRMWEDKIGPYGEDLVDSLGIQVRWDRNIPYERFALTVEDIPVPIVAHHLRTQERFRAF